MIRPARRLRIDLAYDGTDYSGWQFQTRERTVQGTLERVLTRLQGGEPARASGAGRTDAGVHARQQVVDTLLRSRLDDADLHHALRRMLPRDVRPVALRTVSDSFDARCNAVLKTYRYRLDLSRDGDPFLARYAMHHRAALDFDAIKDALRRFRGRRDWSAMAGAACDKDDRVRDLTVARVDVDGPDEAWFTFTADGFVTHMVRNLVGTLLEIGRGRIAAESLDGILASGDRRQAGPTAPPRALVLWSVRYPGDPPEE